MNFIIFDLEATCWDGKPSSMIQEVIEIGALKLNGYGEEEDVRFNRFVRPVINPYLSGYCQNLTSIKQADVDRASTFPTVVEAFQDWIDIFEDDYLLCSWGSFDKRLLGQDCRLHKLEEAWLDSYINLKQQYQDFKRLRRSRGLKAAVEAEGYEFTGIQHRAIADAENLAKLFVRYLDEWQF